MLIIFMQAIEAIGQSVEGMLMKHGKRIIEEQFVLNRLADGIIDAYSMISVLSRASRALEKKLPSAQHESLMAEVWCNEVIIRILICSQKWVH